MSKFGMVVVLILLVLGQMLLLEAMAHESEAVAPLLKPLEHRVELSFIMRRQIYIIAEHPVSRATESSSSEEGKSKAAEAPQIRRLGKHHSTDKSVAGGGVIIGGLVTAIFAAVFCYIRVTRKSRDTANY